MGATFEFGERLGIFIIVESASLSTIAVSLLLTYVAFKSFKRYHTRRAARQPMSTQWINTWQMAATQIPPEHTDDASDSSFFIGLMVAELIQAMGGMLNIQWIIDAAVKEGPLCTTQGILKQLGDMGVAFMSLCIAFQTFSVLVLRWHAPTSASKYIIAAVFLFIALLQSISAATRTHSAKGPYYGNTGFWCWIGNNYRTEKIVFEYMWMWLAAFIMLIIYGITALVMRGILTIGDESQRNGRWRLGWSWSGRKRTRQAFLDDENEEKEMRQAKAIANLMLFYPAVYIICVFPVSLARWLDFSGTNVPPAATIFAGFMFSLSGLLNAILYAITRPDLVRGSPNAEETSAKDRKRRPTGEGLDHKSRANRRDVGHLPDRDDDGDQSYPRDSDSQEAGDKPPWLTLQHSRTESGYTYPASPIGSPENILLGRLPSAPHEGSTHQPNASSSETHKHRQLVSLDTGHLPDVDLDCDIRPGEVQLPRQLLVPRVQEAGRRGSGSGSGLEGIRRNGPLPIEPSIPFFTGTGKGH